jgi:carbamoyl-phosphate synthase small subunit
MESINTVDKRTLAYLVLDDGRIFEGKSWAKSGETFGEAVFSTGMTGYQETLTDPSYHKQIVVMTAPHIGNTGMNEVDKESRRIWVSGFVVRNPSPIASNWRSKKSLEQELIDSDVVGIQGIDTRALTRHLRNRGAMRVGIFSETKLTREEMVVKVRKVSPMSGAYLAKDVTTHQPYIVSPPEGVPTRFKVVAIDLGIKAATPKAMANLGMQVHVLPLDTTFEEIKSMNPGGVFLSNGPGDPAAMGDIVEVVRKILLEEIPFFGICFGHQILGRALGFETYKLPFGHRGINQPVIDLTTGKVEITSHNHGFAVAAPKENLFNTVYGTGRVSHLSLNDSVVEGLEMISIPAFSVQYHPESAAGPHDAAYLFERFAKLMSTPRTGFKELDA